MSKKEENSCGKVSPRSLQRKLSQISRQKSVGEDSLEIKKLRNSVENLHRGTKGSRTDRSLSTDDPNIYERYTDVAKHLKIFYEQFKLYSMREDTKDKLSRVLNEDPDDDPLQILKCMNYILEILATSGLNERYKTEASQEESHVEGEGNGYEELLQKAENDIRQHIRIEQQMKLLIDNLQAKVDEFEKEEESPKADPKELQDAKNENAKLSELLKKKDEEIASMQRALRQKEEVIKSNDEKLLSLTILEHTLKNLKENHKKDKENIRNYYEQELVGVTKEVQHIQRVLSLNLSAEDKLKLLQEELTSSKDFNTKKIQLLENRLRQLDDVPSLSEREDTEPTILHTDPGIDDRRYSVRPLATTAIPKSRGYELNSHRCSTEMYMKGPDSRGQPQKQSPLKKKKDIINELKSTPALRPRSSSKGSVKGEQQSMQGAVKSQKDVENYFNYLKKRLDNLQHVSEKEREQLRSFDGRRSNSVKRGAYLNGSIAVSKERSTDKLPKGDISRTHEEKSDYLTSEKQIKVVPKLLRTTSTTIQTKILKR